jgi:uncharacterized protein YhaN
MRIDHLHLVRFGKFTDRAVSLPRAERDFHVLIGPNEAGKSTLRAAVMDLFFGIPRLSPYTFLHQGDLCIGARIDHLGKGLEFRRVKGNKKTLRDLKDNPLPDDALLPFLSNTNREYFAQMFGLDHQQLVKGGSSILRASDDLGSILFQSAAGIDSLGKVREALESEADKLWAPRKSGDRAYYIAAEELDRATAALKQTTVRGKEWNEAHGRVTDIEAEQAALKSEHVELQKRQRQLERVRRCAPHLNTLETTQTQLQVLGDVPVLPDTAGKTWLDAERALALADADIQRFQQQRDEAQAALEALALDEVVQQYATEIVELNEHRLQYRAYPGDIKSRQAEVDAQWSIAQDLAQRLGWNALDEAGLKAQVPALLVRRELARLIQEHPGLAQALKTAQANEAAKQDDLKTAGDDLATLEAVDAPLELMAALQRAQRLGDYEAAERALNRQDRRRYEELQIALGGLGAWKKDLKALQQMTLPPVRTIRALVAEQAEDALRMKSAVATVRSLQGQIDKLRLEASQHVKTHALVSLEDLQGARQARDLTWHKVKDGQATPDAPTADTFEEEMRTADMLADRRYATVQHTSEWQVKLEQIERLEQELIAANDEVTALDAAQEAREVQWKGLSEAAGLDGLTVQAAEQWFEARHKVLQAGNVASEANEAYALHVDTVQAAETELRTELLKIKQLELAAEMTLAVLMTHAQNHLTLATDAHGQRKSLEKQIREAKRQLGPLARAVQEAQESLTAWETVWANALSTAGLPADSSTAQVKNILEVAKGIEQALVEMANIRCKRIESMQADLEQHAQAAQVLVAALAPELANASVEAIALKLSARLEAANEAHQEATRLRGVVRAAESNLATAQECQSQTQASIQPLLTRARITERADLQYAIERSDQWRELSRAKAGAEQALQEHGDGLTLEQLRAEAAAEDLQVLATEIAELGVKDQELVGQLGELAASLQAANTTLNAIGGAADAARAEAQRQEALSKMTDAVERYLKVYTGARLLRWSIDKYREAKQGPMLQAASRIFAGLTLGSFERLGVDYDSAEPKLIAKRADGSAPLDIEGMSEGTRDQLYLALRLAALETHLNEAHAMPFIADDLFINYDDERSKAGFDALRELSTSTQVLFLTHHTHLLPSIRKVFGADVNVIHM